MDFDWDIFNIEHLARHKVERDEAEEAMTDPASLDIPVHRGPQGQPRQGLLGATETGRVLAVFYEWRQTKVRVVTVRPATPDEIKQYYED